MRQHRPTRKDISGYCTRHVQGMARCLIYLVYRSAYHQRAIARNLEPLSNMKERDGREVREEKLRSSAGREPADERWRSNTRRRVWCGLPGAVVAAQLGGGKRSLTAINALLFATFVPERGCLCRVTGWDDAPRI